MRFSLGRLIERVGRGESGREILETLLLTPLSSEKSIEFKL